MCDTKWPWSKKQSGPLGIILICFSKSLPCYHTDFLWAASEPSQNSSFPPAEEPSAEWVDMEEVLGQICFLTEPSLITVMEIVPAGCPFNSPSPEGSRQEAVLISWILGGFHTSGELAGSLFDLCIHHPELWSYRSAALAPLHPPYAPCLDGQVWVGRSLACSELPSLCRCKGCLFYGAGAYYTTPLSPFNAFINPRKPAQFYQLQTD